MNAVTHRLTRTESGLFGLHVPAFSFTKLAKLLWFWHERSQQRWHLTTLTARDLEDVGISPEAAAAEAAKPFWR